ncbi:MAG: HNH endonuclease [Pseudomonadota bacterium]
MARQPRPDHCELCLQKRSLTFHHLIPRKLHRRSHFRKHYSRDTLNNGIFICRICHRGLHRLHDEMTLGKAFNSIGKILGDDAVARHIRWSAKQKSQ